jgi:DNA topoisomerase VI subunit A
VRCFSQRRLLRYYHHTRSVPVMALVDGDPYGIDILSTYKCGSSAMKHESQGLAAPRLEWIGLRGSELAGYFACAFP